MARQNELAGLPRATRDASGLKGRWALGIAIPFGLQNATTLFHSLYVRLARLKEEPRGVCLPLSIG